MTETTAVPATTKRRTTTAAPNTALELHQQPQQDTSPPAVIQRALAQGVPIEHLKELMAMQERWEANEARKAFNVAFAAFKAEAVTIGKETKYTDGPLKGRSYANLFDIVAAVTPALSKHGLSIAWKLTKDEKDWLEVTCTLRHAGGHSESVSMGAAPDTGPGRNAIQSRGSAKTYLEKYTATAILGLSAADTDDDGSGGKKVELVGKEQLGELRALIATMRTDKAGRNEVEGGLCHYLKVEKLEDLPAKAFNEALASLQQKKRGEEKAAKAASEGKK